MGAEINETSFTIEDWLNFEDNLKKETDYLKELFYAEKCSNKDLVAGFEIEACLINENLNPASKNDELIKKLNSQLVTYELAKFNFEINNTPHLLEDRVFNIFHKELNRTFKKIENVAKSLGVNDITIGILPTLTKEDFCLENMSNMNRYRALNEQILKKRSYKPININISSDYDELIFMYNSVMLESAATSFQLHTQAPFDEIHNYYNASILLSAFMVAISANSPFLFGKRLWQESRIPLFEQSVDTAEKRKRVSFGSGYINNILEPFIENKELYDVLLPINFNSKIEDLLYLKLHNGSIWRWNRALVGRDSDETIHFRVEHRVMPSGPTLKDMLANAAFFYGLEYSFAKKFKEKEDLISFENAKDNFYKAAKYGLDAKIFWSGKKESIEKVVLDELLELSKVGLEELNIDKKDIEFYLGIIEKRVKSKQNGANWQCKFVDKYGDNMRELTRIYLKNQKSGEEVAKWEI